MKARWIRVSLLLLIVMGLLAACGGAAPQASAPTAAPAAEPATAAPAAAEATSAPRR